MRRIKRIRERGTARLEAGQGVAEFAVVVPILMFFLLMGGEAAGAVAAHEVLSNAAREGARLAATPGELGLTSAIQTRAINYAAANGITLPAADVAVNQAVLLGASPFITASSVTIRYTYPFQYLPRLPFGWGASVSLGASVTMRNLY